MKYFPSLFLHYLRTRATRRNLRILTQFMAALVAMITVYSVLFHYLMAGEGREFSWITGVYWTLTVMSTLGFGDITFHTDLGLLFSIIVLLSGMLFMLTLLPFTFIQFFYAPWMEAQAEARAPRQLPKETSGHVVLTNYGPVSAALISKLNQYRYPYVILVRDITEALKLHDMGLNVVVGDLDDPETYRKVCIDQAALLATTHTDVVNTNVAFTAREVSADVPIVATALADGSVDILELAGCNRVFRLAEMIGQSLARRVLGRDAKTHEIGHFDSLVIAEASTAGTPLVGRTLREIRLREHVSITVAGVWERGHFKTVVPETQINESTVLVLAGSRSQLQEYDGLFCIYHSTDIPAVILGGGRVGSATARALKDQGIDYRIVEKAPAGPPDDRVVVGDAADLETLEKAGIMETPVVVITTHDDDLNVYLALYCRRLRPDVQIISRATSQRNVTTLHRAGADFVISEASMGANGIFNVLRAGGILLLAEGLDVFRIPIPPSLAGKTIAQSGIRQETGCSVIAIEGSNGLQVNMGPDTLLTTGTELLVIGSVESEARFLDRYVDR